MNFKKLGLGLVATAAMTTGMALAEAPAEAASLAPGGFTLQATGNPTVTQIGSGIGSTDTLNFAALDFNIILDTGSLDGTLTEAAGGIQVSPLTLTSLGSSFGTEFFSNGTNNSFITGLLFNGDAVVFDLGSSFGTASFSLSGGNYTGSSLDGTLRRLAGGSAVAQATIASLSFGGSGFTNIQAATVPTPALLPGLIGMGLAAMRKRKGEQVEHSDTVKA